MAQQPAAESPTESKLEEVAETVLEGLGFELVELEKAGHRGRPILRLRIDRPGSEPGRGVTVDDCAKVSRELEASLEVHEDLPSSYILEVSSPGVDRPLRKPKDYDRHVGREIMVRGFRPLAGCSKRVQGVLVGTEGEGSERIRIRTSDGTEVVVPLSGIAKAHLVFKWDEFNFDSPRDA